MLCVFLMCNRNKFHGNNGNMYHRATMSNFQRKRKGHIPDDIYFNAKGNIFF